MGNGFDGDSDSDDEVSPGSKSLPALMNVDVAVVVPLVVVVVYKSFIVF